MGASLGPVVPEPAFVPGSADRLRRDPSAATPVPPGLHHRAGEACRGFAALADPARLLILHMLSRSGTLCVCQLQAALSLAQPTVSHHLKVLREAGLVESERRGPWVHYRLRRDGLKALTAALLDVL